MLRVDDSAVTPETREELIDGRVVHAAPAHVPHGDQHFRLDYLLAAYQAPGYEGSTDLLTRTSEEWNFAPDASIRKAGIDPDTDSRYLEELAFEIKHTQRLDKLSKRARQLVARGVRRVFVIAVKQGGQGRVQAGPVLEWSREQDDWVMLAPEDSITDPCLVMPLPVRALLSATAADDDVLEALAAKGNRALRKREQQSKREGKREGLREGIHALCEALDIELTAARAARIQAMDLDALDALLAALRTERRWPQSL